MRKGAIQCCVYQSPALTRCGSAWVLQITKNVGLNRLGRSPQPIPGHTARLRARRHLPHRPWMNRSCRTPGGPARWCRLGDVAGPSGVTGLILAAALINGHRPPSSARRQPAQSEVTHELRNAHALSIGFLLQLPEVVFGEANQNLRGQPSRFAIAQRLLRALGRMSTPRRDAVSLRHRCRKIAASGRNWCRNVVIMSLI